MSYTLLIRKNIYNLVGQMPKADIVRIFGNQDISAGTVHQVIVECQQGIPCINFPKSGRLGLFIPSNQEE